MYFRTPETTLLYLRSESAWIKVGQRKFPLTYYTDQWNRQQPEYQLTLTETLFVATKFNDEARAKLVLKYVEQQQRQQIDLSNPDTVAIIVGNWYKEHNQRLAPKVGNDLFF